MDNVVVEMQDAALVMAAIKMTQVGVSIFPKTPNTYTCPQPLLCAWAH
jgi:hypothetical protein